jgi:hypothetical protein
MHHDVRDLIGWSVFDPIADKLVSANQPKLDTRFGGYRNDPVIRSRPATPEAS